jgi:uncharacterized protein YutE (UPF0331/DUF86 family)
MLTQTVELERERLWQLANEYRDQGYNVLIEPQPDDLPEFLRDYRPNMIGYQGNEAVVVEVKSRRSLNAYPAQYLQNLSQLVQQHPGWRFELVIVNPTDAFDVDDALIDARPLQPLEIKTQLPLAQQLADHHPESAMLYAWSLAEAACRLIAEQEGLSLPSYDPWGLIKKLVMEGAIARAEYQLLRDMLSLRNAIAHGFKVSQLTPELIAQLIAVVEQLLQALEVGAVVA